ncbi:ArnT family glycosyltransferase [Halomicrococcus sp. NG-SE-24]|uniref:ArnT family glycosyltransferase n=1 Tax=Halomicrococcus sp. NG-SE-24 TaxID=3436928 RepID=UPI003D98B932
MSVAQKLRNATVESTAASERTRHVAALLPPVAAALSVYLAYLLTHPLPGYGAGLYGAMAEAILANGYRLPARIPHYTSGGIPFAYPPLGFYGLAGLLDLTGLDYLTLVRVLPGLFALGYVVAAYFLAYQLLGTRRRASVAAVVVATSPTITTMHLTAGGVVRAPAFAVLTAGLYAGVRLFQTHRRRWLYAGVACFAVLLLTHPVNAASFAFSYLFLYAVLDRTRRGLAFGATVAVAGFVLTSPWWATVLARHGTSVFARASGTHGGLGLEPLGPLLFWYTPNLPFPSLWHLLVLLGGCYLLARRKLLLPGWLAVSLLVFPGRVTMLVGAMVAAVGLWGAASVATTRTRSLPVSAPTVVVALLCLYGAGTGAMHVANYPGVDDATATQSYLDDGDLEAMRWIQSETPPEASFVVVGDVGEWFPLFAERTSLVSYRGTEWEGRATQQRHLQTKQALTNCRDADCLTATLVERGLSPDYLYLPRGQYSSLYRMYEQSPEMRHSLAASDRYRIVYRNRDAVVVRVVDLPAET